MKITLYAVWRQWDWEDEGRIIVCSDNYAESLGGSGDYKLLETLHDVELPDFEKPSRAEVAKLKTDKLTAKKCELMADTQKKIEIIDDKIRQLSALTYDEDIPQ